LKVLLFIGDIIVSPFHERDFVDINRLISPSKIFL